MARELLPSRGMSLGYTRSVRAVMLEVPEDLLADRRRKGLDRRDEVWAGVLHMVPPASSNHNRLGRDLMYVLQPVVERKQLELLYETGVFDPAEGLRDYRVPDLVIASPDVISERGVEGTAAVVVEVLSPDDESYDKLPFYARVGVREAWLIDPVTRTIELYARHGSDLVCTRARIVRSAELDLALETVAGRLRIHADGRHHDL